MKTIDSFKRSMWLTWFISVATIILFSFNVVAAEPIKASKQDTVKDHRYMKSDVTLYKNGQLVISTKSWSRKANGGLKNQSVFVVCVDDNGNAIRVSNAFRMTTVGGTRDRFTSSEHTDVNQENTPPAIGQHTKSIDIYHSAGDLSQNRKSQVESVKEAIRIATDIAQEVKNAVETLQ